MARIDALEAAYEERAGEAPSQFFEACFAPNTLGQILYLRCNLDWENDRVDRFVAAMVLGALHGESHRSDLYLSNRMPRTISTKPEYSVRWWRDKGLVAPERDSFHILRRLAAFRYRMPPAKQSGMVKKADSRLVGHQFPSLHGQVKLVVTSPPYLDTTDYAEDQWLRLWFLGGQSRPIARQHKDDRITRVSVYWAFLSESWAGIQPLLHDTATIVIRIGGAALTKCELYTGVEQSLKEGLDNFAIKALTSGITSSIRPRETSAFRPTANKSHVEHDFTFKLRRNNT